MQFGSLLTLEAETWLPDAVLHAEHDALIKTIGLFIKFRVSGHSLKTLCILHATCQCSFARVIYMRCGLILKADYFRKFALAPHVSLGTSGRAFDCLRYFEKKNSLAFRKNLLSSIEIFFVCFSLNLTIHIPSEGVWDRCYILAFRSTLGCETWHPGVTSHAEHDVPIKSMSLCLDS